MDDSSERAGETETPHILVAEDNAVNRKLAVTLVEKWGFIPVVAENGKQALAAVADERVDLILMDVQMPVMDGLEATRAIRAQEAEGGKHLPIVALTAHAYASDRAECMSAGMDEYLTKPVEPSALRETILRLLHPAEARVAGVVAADPAHTVQPLLDREEALGRVDGDLDLLEEIASLFLDSCAEWLEDLRLGIAESDGEAIRRAAHTLKGSAASFGARPLVESALRVEEIGASQNLTGVAEAVRALELQVDALVEQLRSLVDEGDP
jgi:CheY-like chemotaxis protein